jgi:DEAD/DEAH box helicase domain-containing protein
MFKIFKSITNKAVDSSANPLDAISQAKANTKERDEKRLQQSKQLYLDALELIKQFKINYNDRSFLIEASEILEESLKLNHNNGESYFWLAYILYNFGQIKGALNYLKKAESFIPDYPQLKQLKEIISLN